MLPLSIWSGEWILPTTGRGNKPKCHLFKYGHVSIQFVDSIHLKIGSTQVIFQIIIRGYMTLTIAYE